MVLSATAWERDELGALTEIPGIVIAWESEAPELAAVDQREDGTALVTPVNEGVVTIRAVAAEFESATPGTIQLRIASSLAIDSVRPATVHYGEQVRVFGIGLGEVLRVSLGQADLVPDEASFSGEPQGAGSLAFWVPYPAESDRLVAVGRRGLTAAAPETTLVRPQDRYHELEAPPPAIHLDGPAPRPPDTLFYNPALSVVEGEDPDAFVLHRARTGQSMTIIVTSTGQVVPQVDPVLTPDLEVPSAFPNPDGISDWAVGFSGQSCRFSFFSFGRPVAVTAPVVLKRAFKDPPFRDLLLAIYGSPAGNYSVTIKEGYVTADPRIGPDRFEENDYCAGADANSEDPNLLIELPFSDTLTIDNGYEVDWLRFSIPGDVNEPVDTLITIRTAARPFGATDSSDVGLLLVKESRLELEADARTAGSAETLTAEIETSFDYYVVVLDEGGVATRYSICVDYGTTCRLPEETASGP
jgi:hypothetical protein